MASNLRIGQIILDQRLRTFKYLATMPDGRLMCFQRDKIEYFELHQIMTLEDDRLRIAIIEEIRKVIASKAILSNSNRC